MYLPAGNCVGKATQRAMIFNILTDAGYKLFSQCFINSYFNRNLMNEQMITNENILFIIFYCISDFYFYLSRLLLLNLSVQLIFIINTKNKHLFQYKALMIFDL